MEENKNENGKKAYEESAENQKENINMESDLLDSPSINDPYDDLEDEAETEEKKEKENGEAEAEKKKEEPGTEEKKKSEAEEEQEKKEEKVEAEKKPEGLGAEENREKEKNGETEQKTEQKQNHPHIIVAGGETFYSREFTKQLISQVLKLQAEGMIRYGKNFMQNEPGMQQNRRNEFGLSPVNPAGISGYGYSGMKDQGTPGQGATPWQMSQYGKQAGNTREGATLLGELAYIFGEVPILGILLQLLDKIWKGCMNIARKTDEVLNEAAGRSKPDQRLQQMMQETEALRDSCRQRLEADRNFVRQAGTYMDASMGTNYMGADRIPEYGAVAGRLSDPAVSPEFSGFLNVNRSEKTAEDLLEAGKTLREKNEVKKESAEREKGEKDNIAKEEGQQEKTSAGERRRSRDDSDLISHRRPTMEQINMEPQKERSRGRSL